MADVRQAQVDEINRRLKERGFAPGELQATMRGLRGDHLAPFTRDEIELGLLDALANMGGATVWVGDGSSCATQIVEHLIADLQAKLEQAERERAATCVHLEAQLGEAREAIRVRDQNDHGLFMEAFRQTARAEAAESALAAAQGALREARKAWAVLRADMLVSEGDLKGMRGVWFRSGDAVAEVQAVDAALAAESGKPGGQEIQNPRVVPVRASGSQGPAAHSERRDPEPGTSTGKPGGEAPTGQCQEPLKCDRPVSHEGEHENTSGTVLTREELERLLERGARGADELFRSLKASFRLPGVDYIDSAAPAEPRAAPPALPAETACPDDSDTVNIRTMDAVLDAFAFSPEAVEARLVSLMETRSAPGTAFDMEIVRLRKFIDAMRRRLRDLPAELSGKGEQPEPGEAKKEEGA